MESLAVEKETLLDEQARLLERLRVVDGKIRSIQESIQAGCTHPRWERGCERGIDERAERVCTVCGLVL